MMKMKKIASLLKSKASLQDIERLLMKVFQILHQWSNQVISHLNFLNLKPITRRLYNQNKELLLNIIKTSKDKLIKNSNLKEKFYLKLILVIDKITEKIIKYQNKSFINNNLKIKYHLRFSLIQEKTKKI